MRTRTNWQSRTAASAAAWFLPGLLLAVAGCGPQAGADPAAGDTPGDVTDGATTTDIALPPNPPPLSAVPVPRPAGGDIVNDEAAIRLGKALFWDVQVGSDGQTACASCHHRAGADSRARAAVHPGPDGEIDAADGPGDPWDGAAIAPGSDDRVGSPGIAAATFVGVDPDPASAADLCTPATSPLFGEARQVTDRNAPSVIDAVFYRALFWDGRANPTFNGRDPFGDTKNSPGGALVHVENAALASQSMGPPGNAVEMACLGRPMNGPGGLGAKLLARTPLGKQRVSAADGVLGPVSAAPGNGLTVTYQDLIDAAFAPAVAQEAEAQFSRIFGQAIQAYESTLIADQTPFDHYLAGDESAMTEKQLAGWDAFRDRRAGDCFNCHAGPELSDATFGFAAENGLYHIDGGDQGFHNVGSSLTADDPGRAGVGPNGEPYSKSGSTSDKGAFKTPGLRNVKLTAPYMHNGSVADLEGILAFYADHEVVNREESVDVAEVQLTDEDRANLLDFLTNALTDCRVEKELAPFDHPSLPLPGGEPLAEVGASGTGPCP